MTTYETRNISVSIARDWREVAAFLAQPANYPLWASGLASGLQEAGEEWIADGGPSGRIRIRFSPLNPFGVADHTVFLEDGAEVYVPLRAIRNGDGCEVIFTLFRVPGMSAEQFRSDAEWVERDLQKLKDVLEKAD
jgi:hypothetical protein